MFSLSAGGRRNTEGKSKMGKENGKVENSNEKKRPMLNVGVVMSCGAEVKLLVTAFLLICTVFTFLQFLPPSSRFSASDLRSCLSQLSSSTPSRMASSTSTTTRDQLVIPSTTNRTITTVVNTSTAAISDSTLASSQRETEDKSKDEEEEEEEPKGGGVLKRTFRPYGTAAYNFINMGAYRGGPNTFAIVGLSSKPIHVFSKPTYLCEWVPSRSSTTFNNITAVGYKILPDWGYGRVYTVVVVNCTFPDPINADNSGGKLLLHASTSGGQDRDFNLTDTFNVLLEKPGKVDFSIFSNPPNYDYLYCGSPLYGNLSPQRVREWLAYHVRLFGGKSHFVIQDAGGVHPEVMEVLKPWMELGYVTLHDIKEQERFDGYYHNQFMVVNDCLQRYKFQAKWMFFFDLDEYIYVPPKNTLRSVLNSLREYNQFTIEQMPMHSKLCLSEDYGRYYRKWGFEKLVYRDVKRGIRRDRKYAIQPRNVYATGVHMSQNLDGKTTHKTESKIKYFHYHGTIAQRREPCRNLLNVTQLDFENNPYVLDTTMRDIAWSVKKFELKTIGHRLQKTRQ